jgi:catechol 2,3-dioxygenase-like lactoylglutathione lyase family enzyme
MIKDVPLTGIFVNDQQSALDFYTNKLGLELIQDEPYGEGALDHGLARGDEHQDRTEEGRKRA